MKILILNWRDTKNPLGGGAEISLFEHAKYWAKQGAQVIWFAASFRDAKEKEIMDKVTIIRKGSAYTVHLWGFYYYLKGRLGKPDIIVDSFHGIPFFSVLYIPRKKIVGLINEIAGKLWFLNAPFVIAGLGYLLEPIFVRLYKNNAFITGSNSTKEELKKNGILSEMIYVVHHGIHICRPRATIKKEEAPTIMYLGRVAQDKGIIDALSAFSRIKREIPNAILWIAGGEEKEGTLDGLLNKIDDELKKSIVYWGFITEEKKFELLKRTWILLHPSYKEGWGLTVIEAASQGVPTVGYNVAGLQDSVQNGTTGILVLVRNTERLAEGVCELIKKKDMYNRFSKQALVWSKQFTWPISVKKSWSIIKKIYEKSKSQK